MKPRSCHKLANIARKMGYQAEVVARWKGGDARNQPSFCYLRMRRTYEIWSWCFSPRDWSRTIRYFRQLDRVGK